MSATETALTAHLVMTHAVSDEGLLARVADDLHDKFEIEYATVQIDVGDSIYQCRHCLTPKPK